MQVTCTESGNATEEEFFHMATPKAGSRRPQRAPPASSPVTTGSTYPQMFESLTAVRFEDPLATLRLPFVDEYVKPLYTHETLDTHIHELIGFVLFYHAIYLTSSLVSPLLFPNVFKAMSTKLRIDFHIHVVSMIQAIAILIAILPLFNDPVLAADRVFGYTPYAGLITVAALGYFIWDAIICLRFVNFFGVGFLVHGTVSASVFYIGISPFISYYAAIFILFEVSTPFLNLRWFALKIPGLFSDTFQLINNAILMLVFFFVRIGYGWYQAYKLFGDFYDTYQDPRFHTVGAIVIFTGNVVLNTLNVYWFYRMVKVAYAVLADIATGTNAHEEAKKDI